MSGQAVDRDWIERQLAASPPLTEQQKADLRRVLTPARRSA